MGLTYGVSKTSTHGLRSGYTKAYAYTPDWGKQKVW